MTWTITEHLFKAIEKAMKSDPRAGKSSSGEVATILVTLGIRVAETGKVMGGAIRLLASSMPSLQPDEEKAVAEVRQAYASLRRVEARNLMKPN